MVTISFSDTRSYVYARSLPETTTIVAEIDDVSTEETQTVIATTEIGVNPSFTNDEVKTFTDNKNVSASFVNSFAEESKDIKKDSGNIENTSNKVEAFPQFDIDLMNAEALDNSIRKEIANTIELDQRQPADTSLHVVDEVDAPDFGIFGQMQADALLTTENAQTEDTSTVDSLHESAFTTTESTNPGEITTEENNKIKTNKETSPEDISGGITPFEDSSSLEDTTTEDASHESTLTITESTNPDETATLGNNESKTNEETSQKDIPGGITTSQDSSSLEDTSTEDSSHESILATKESTNPYKITTEENNKTNKDSSSLEDTSTEDSSHERTSQNNERPEIKQTKESNEEDLSTEKKAILDENKKSNEGVVNEISSTDSYGNLNNNNALSGKEHRPISQTSDSVAPPSNVQTNPLNVNTHIGNDKLTSDTNPKVHAAVIPTILICIGLMVGVALGITLMIIKRQHGTLDIELQEKRCGKDDLNEEASETHAKLLDVDLPAPSVTTALTSAEKNDDCL